MPIAEGIPEGGGRPADTRLADIIPPPVCWLRQSRGSDAPVLAFSPIRMRIITPVFPPCTKKLSGAGGGGSVRIWGYLKVAAAPVIACRALVEVVAAVAPCHPSASASATVLSVPMRPVNTMDNTQLPGSGLLVL